MLEFFGFKEYYFVTAYTDSTNSNMVRMPIIPMNVDDADKVEDFLNALVETYVGKLLGTVADMVKGVSFLPYEMLTYTTDMASPCSYQIDATYTTTVRFIWTLSHSLNYYTLEGVTHSAYIEDHHVMRYVHSGTSHTDSYNSTYRRSTPYYDLPETIVVRQWESYAPKAYAEIVEDVEYYYQPNENDPKTRKFVKTETVPYAVSYTGLN